MAILEANFGSRASCSVEVDDVIYVSSAHGLRQKFAHVLVNTEPDITGTLTFYVGNGGTVFERFTSWEVAVSHTFDWTSTPFPPSFVDAVADWIDGSDSYEMEMWVALTTQSATYDDRVKVKVRMGEGPETSPEFDLAAAPFGAGSDYGLLQNLTQIMAEVSNAGVGKGSVESVVIKCLGWRSDSAALVTPAVYRAGTVEVEATVTSTLNVSARKTVALECIPYERPSISSASVFRCLEDGTPKDDAAWARAEASWSFHPLGGDNSCSASVSYRALGSDSWSDPVPLASGAPAVIAGDLDMTVSYEALFSVRDRFATAQGILDIAIPYFTIDLLKGGRGIAFGTASDEEGFKVGMAAKFLAAVEMAKELVVGAKAKVASLVVDGTAEIVGVLTAKANAVFEKAVSITGDLTTNMHYIRDGKRLQRNGSGSSWYNGRDNALVRNATCTNTGSWWAAVSAKSYNGSWEMGAIGTNNQLGFAYILDSDYNAGNNRRQKYFGIDPSGSYEGILTNSNYIRTPLNGILPCTTSGASYCGTTSWPWNSVASNGYYKKGVAIWMPTAWSRASIASGNVTSGANVTQTGTVSVPSGTTQVFPVVESPPANLMVNGITATLSGTTVTVRVLFKNNLSKTVSGTCYVRVMAYV